MGLKVEANIMAQIVENVPPRDYLKEGEKIMKDAFQLLAQIKQNDKTLVDCLAEIGELEVFES